VPIYWRRASPPASSFCRNYPPFHPPDDTLLFKSPSTLFLPCSFSHQRDCMLRLAPWFGGEVSTPLGRTWARTTTMPCARTSPLFPPEFFPAPPCCRAYPQLTPTTRMIVLPPVPIWNFFFPPIDSPFFPRSLETPALHAPPGGCVQSAPLTPLFITRSCRVSTTRCRSGFESVNKLFFLTVFPSNDLSVGQFYSRSTCCRTFFVFSTTLIQAVTPFLCSPPHRMPAHPPTVFPVCRCSCSPRLSCHPFTSRELSLRRFVLKPTACPRFFNTFAMLLPSPLFVHCVNPSSFWLGPLVRADLFMESPQVQFFLFQLPPHPAIGRPLGPPTGP